MRANIEQMRNERRLAVRRGNRIVFRKPVCASPCLAEREDKAPPPLVETVAWGYVRLRLEHYSPADLAAWASRLAATGWEEAYVYFMHEPTAPGYAAALLQHQAS